MEIGDTIQSLEDTKGREMFILMERCCVGGPRALILARADRGRLLGGGASNLHSEEEWQLGAKGEEEAT